jgi:inorganic triphosphatase YgiF
VSGSDQVERELKLGAWPEFVLPDLTGAIDGIRTGTSTRRELDAVYYDTPDLSLLRRGATLRFRRGEPPGDVWTAKLPSDAVQNGLARREITVEGRRGAIPGEFSDLMRAWALGRRVRPVARVHTLRQSVSLFDEKGGRLASLDDDAVTVLRGRQVLARFRELEVELVGDAPEELIAAVDERLRAAGAEKVPQIPKLGRALGRAAALPWQLAEPATGSKPTLAALAHARLVVLISQLVDLHAPLVADADGAAHGARIAVERLHAGLDALGPLFDPEPPEALRRRLDWLAAELTAPDELDAVLARVRAASPLLSGTAARGLEARVGTARSRARSRLLRTLRERRYTQLLQQLADLAATPPAPSPAGKRRAGSAASKFVRGQVRPLRNAESSDPPALRAAVDRLATALEVAGNAQSADSGATVERVELLRAAAAEHREATAVAERLAALARRAGPAESWAAGLVTGLELARAEAGAVRFAQLRAQAASA